MNDDRVFAKFPVLQTERLLLRELRSDDDLAPYFAMFSSPEVMRYIGRPVHKDIEESREFLERNRIQFAHRTGIRWAITLRGDDRMIGSVGHWRLMKEHNRAEIGYDLHESHWGKGLMPEALRAVLRFGFVEMELHSTEAQIDPDNQRSRRVLERLGFRSDGRIRENFLYDGRYIDSEVFTLLDREFLKNP
jgi:[ribosomal protein S5]-alanine N-acetyltransferase